MNRSHPLFPVLPASLVVGSLFLLTSVANADSTWNVSSGDWSVAGNWLGGVPTSGSGAIINGGTASMTLPGAVCNSLSLGYASTTSTGTVQVSGNGQLASNWEYVGWIGTGTLIQSGGINNSGNELALGFYVSSSGTYNLSGTGQLLAQSEYIGGAGTGMFTHSGGTNTCGTVLCLANASGSSGTYNLTDGKLSADTVWVGGGGTGIFNQSGGINNANTLFLNYADGSSGTYNLSGGQLSAQWQIIGNGSTGTFMHSGGTNSCSGGWILGMWFGSNGTYSLSGNGQLLTLGETVGLHGTGAFTQSSGINNSGTALTLGTYADGSGTYELNGGTLIANQISGGLGTSVVNFNGGLLQAAVGANSTFMSGLTNAYVQSGGVNIDSNGQNITISQSLLDAGGGGGMTKYGLGSLTLAGSNTYTGGTAINQGTLNVTGSLSGGNVLITGGASLTGSGNVTCSIAGSIGSSIVATGNISLGDFTSFTGFNHAGTLTIGSNAVTLNSKGFSNLGSLTSISGGTLNAPNGMSFGVGCNLSGSGVVQGKVSAGFGSTIEATGNLTLGNATSTTGFTSDGELWTNANAVTIDDANEAVLGSLTKMGDGVSGGTLTAGAANPSHTYAHFLLEEGKNLEGRGTINGNFKNQGHAKGDGTGLNQRLVFSSPWKVSGKGTFENTLVEGIFAPGESPGIVNGTNQGFSGTVAFELGGLTPGFGSGHYDQINDSASILLLTSTVLAIQPYEGFLPQPGDEFTVMTWQSSLDGTFGGVQVDPWFASHGISFDVQYNNVAGAGSLVLTAVPEPSVLVLLGVGTTGLIGYGLRKTKAATMKMDAFVWCLCVLFGGGREGMKTMLCNTSAMKREATWKRCDMRRAILVLVVVLTMAAVITTRGFGTTNGIGIGYNTSTHKNEVYGINLDTGGWNLLNSFTFASKSWHSSDLMIDSIGQRFYAFSGPNPNIGVNESMLYTFDTTSGSMISSVIVPGFGSSDGRDPQDIQIVAPGKAIGIGYNTSTHKNEVYGINLDTGGWNLLNSFTFASKSWHSSDLMIDSIGQRFYAFSGPNPNIGVNDSMLYTFDTTSGSMISSVIVPGFGSSDGRDPQDIQIVAPGKAIGIGYNTSTHKNEVYGINLDTGGWNLLNSFTFASKSWHSSDLMIDSIGQRFYAFSGPNPNIGVNDSMLYTFDTTSGSMISSVIVPGFGSSDGRDPQDIQIVAPVPEPTTLVLLGAGAITIIAYAWRRRKKA